MREIELPSGAVLKVQAAPFAQAKALYQAILKEVKGIQISSTTDMSSVYKDIFCLGFSSEAIEKCLNECLKRCTYNSGNGDLKISDDTFEPVKQREDYLSVCVEVTKENVLPFVKSLYAEFQHILETIEKVQS